MTDYQQPEFYRFNQDSLQLVSWVKTKISSAESILDLGAGSGIIGIELARALKPKRVTFVELQLEYKAYLEENIRTFLPPETTSQIELTSFSDFRPTERYPVIVSNPPYYLPGRGQLPPNLNKARARSFLVDSWSVLLEKISLCLEPEGSCFIVLTLDVWLLDYVRREAARWGLTLEQEASGNVMFLLLRLNVD